MKYNPILFSSYLEANKIVTPEYEYKFHPSRKWRFDIAWPEKKLALEVQGGIFIQGRHSRGASLLKEWEKLNEAACMGWRLIYCQPDTLMTFSMLTTITRALR